MQMPPNQNAATSTQAAMMQAQQPASPGQPSQPPAQGPQQPGQGDQSFGSDPEIMQNLEQHLNQLPDKQKQFLAGAIQHYANIVIPTLGIVCGQEVFQYFVDMYQQHFAKNQPGQQDQPPQQNTPHPATGQPNSGQPQMQPNQGPNPAAQQPPVQPAQAMQQPPQQ